MNLLLPIKHIADEHDVKLIKQVLTSFSSIEFVQVEFNNQRINLPNLSPIFQLKPIVDQLKNVGIEAILVTKTFPVLRLSCASCANSVESMLKAQPNVYDAQINFATASVQITFVPSDEVLVFLQQQIRSIGYDLVIEEHVNDHFLEAIQLEKYKELKSRTIGSLIFALPVFILGMFWMENRLANWLTGLLAIPVVFYYGRQFHQNAFRLLRYRTFNMDTLVSMSTLTAFFFSAVVLLFPAVFHHHGHHQQVYFEASAVIIALILLGKLLEENAKEKTATALKKLIGLQPNTVVKWQEDGTISSIPIQSVGLDDVLLARPGDKIAVDGIILEGESTLDESMLTGESLPIDKQKGDAIFAGTINRTSTIKYKVNQLGQKTLLAQIISAVEKAQGSKAPVQQLADKIAAVFVPVVITIAFLSFIFWFIYDGYTIQHALISFVTVLVIACPCALGLATPTAIMVGIGKSASQGILIKDAESLEKISEIDTILLDKTGTITAGEPKVTGAYWLNDTPFYRSCLLQIEQQSSHPLAQAIVSYLKGTTIEPFVFQSNTFPGKGVEVKSNDTYFWVGSEQFVTEHCEQLKSEHQANLSAFLSDKGTTIWFGHSAGLIAVFSLADVVKPNSKQAITQLKERGIAVYMLTGDNQVAADEIAQQVGLTDYHAGMLPADKAAFVQRLQKEGHLVAMVGDGINDSSALAYADVSIAMGKGSDIAMDVAKMTIVHADLAKLPIAITLSKQTNQTIKQNLFWAFIYNIIGIPIAAGVLYPLNGFQLNPMLAGAAMGLSSVSVVSNSLRLKNMKIKRDKN